MKMRRAYCVMLISILLVLGLEIALFPKTVEGALVFNMPNQYYSAPLKMADAGSIQVQILADAPSIQVATAPTPVAPVQTDKEKRLRELIAQLTALLAQLRALQAK